MFAQLLSIRCFLSRQTILELDQFQHGSGWQAVGRVIWLFPFKTAVTQVNVQLFIVPGVQMSNNNLFVLKRVIL
jgi:hypothetical protein